MIADNVRAVMRELPDGVRLLVAAKGRSTAEVLAAVEAGAGIIGENYVQQAERHRAAAGSRVEWHLIGHLQSNKAKKAVRTFDMIETVDSLEIAHEIDARCAQMGRTMPALVEVNIAREAQKSGVLPEDVESLVRALADLPHIRVMGLMTIGPITGEPEGLRPYFRETKCLFDRIAALGITGVVMKYLSMGMSDSYRVAVEEGANIVRIGSRIFGPRAD